jgi:AcrR family transcriptional regulator
MTTRGRTRSAARRRVIKPAETRREELLEAATHLFAERGVEQVTVGDIATAAGLAKGSFYLHFETKERLIDALRERFAARIATTVSSLSLPTGSSGWGSFTNRLVKAAIQSQVELHDLHAVMRAAVHRHGDGEEHAAHADDPARSLIREIIAAGQRAGGYRDGDVEVTSWLVYELLHSAGELALHAPNNQSRITRTTADLLRRSLLAVPE